MDEARTVAVNIVAWNSMAYLPQLFLSLDGQTSQDFSVTVVDNASNDGIVAWLQGERPQVAALRNFRNQGFARAHNQAAALALTRWSEDAWPHRYILITNPDLEFAPTAIEALIAYMDAHPEVMACGPKLLRAHAIASEDETRETERTNVIDSTGIVMRKSRRHFDRGAGEEDKGQYDAATEVFGVSGACLLLRASAIPGLLLKGELFDEDMHAYKEDVDLCWRMQRLGMPIRLVPGAVVWHHRRAPSGKQGFLWLAAFFRRFKKPKYVNELSTRNHIWLIVKNDEVANMLMHAIWIVPYEAGKIFIGIFQPTCWRAWFNALGGMPRMWSKRQELRKRATVRGRDIRRWFV